MLLTASEYRTLHETALEDEALQLLLDAAYADIVAHVGDDTGTTTEWLAGGFGRLALRGTASSIASVSEVYGSTETDLASDDYELDPSGVILWRLSTGTNARRSWYGQVRVTYVPRDSDAQRRVVQADLVHLAETYSPGVGLTVVGSWTQQYAQAVGANRDEHDAILSRLTERGRMLVV